MSIAFGDVQGGLDGVDSYGELNWGPGMIDADPKFFDPENGDYHLLHGSPCIDAGNNLAVPEGVTTDYDGDPRFLDDPNVPDTGNPDPDAPELPIVDMGPDEFDHQDCNNNDVPDEQDIADGTSTDVDEDGIPDECQLDCNGNDIPDTYDIIEGTSGDCDDDGIPDECEADPGPPITQQPADAEVQVGDFVIFIVQADGPLLEYQWRKDGTDLTDTERIFGAQSAALLIFDVQSTDAGAYDCVIMDLVDLDCITSDTATLTVLPFCPADFDDDGTVGASDLAFLLGNWGPCPDPDACPADLNNDDIINAFDLAILLGAWGSCE